MLLPDRPFPPALRTRIFFAPLLLLGAVTFLHVLQVMYGRVAYPYELEWMEGGMLHQVLRVLHGEPLYGDPSLGFVPALYMPLYYYVSALSALLVGENLFALRLVSVAASLATHWLVYLIVLRTSRSVLSALLGLSLYALMFRHTGFWFDVARVDSLWAMWLALMFYALLRYRDKPVLRHAVLLAGAAVLAFFTKQATLFLLPFAAVTVWCWTGWQGLQRLLLPGLAMAAVLLLCCLLFTGGDFLFYTLQMAGSHGVTWFGVQRFLSIVGNAVPSLIIASIAFCFYCGGRARDRAGWLALLAGFVFLSGLSRAYAGAFFNVLMPLYCCLAITAATGFGWLVERSRGSAIRTAGVALLLAFMLLDIWRYRFDPATQVPSPQTWQATAALVQRIASVDGPVCVASHGYLAWLAGKDFCAHNTQVTDLVTGADRQRAQRLLDDARQKILGGHYAAILLDREKELHDLGLQLSGIPYTVTAIDYPQGPIRFPVNGHAPALWLQFNGGTTVQQETPHAQ